MSKTKKIENWGGARDAAFTDAKVAKIRKLAAEGLSVADIARKVDARYDTTSRVVKGYSYKHLPLTESYKYLVDDRAIVGGSASKDLRTYQAAAIESLTAGKSTTVFLSDAVKAGVSIKDCDPRRERHGYVIRVNETAAIPSASVKWNTGKETAVRLDTIHRKPESKKGFLILDASATTTETATQSAVA